MEVEGIFRKSGGLISIQKYREAFDLGTFVLAYFFPPNPTQWPQNEFTFYLHLGEKPNLEECNDPHAIAGLLKLYLRTLPEPLVPFDFYPKFKAALELTRPEDKQHEFKALINALPMVPLPTHPNTHTHTHTIQ